MAFFGTEQEKKEKRIQKAQEYIDNFSSKLVLIEENQYTYEVYDRETLVIYLLHTSYSGDSAITFSLTPLLQADGKPKLYQTEHGNSIKINNI